jgi:hypothetical protein
MNAWATIVVEGTWLNERECEINNVEIDGVVYKQDQGLLVKRDVSFLGSIEMCVCWRQLFVTFRLQIASTKETCWVCLDHDTGLPRNARMPDSFSLEEHWTPKARPVCLDVLA